jgi:hypothetical protein
MFDKLSQYVHLPTHDEFFDSICTACATTVGHHMTEAELEATEKNHVCDRKTMDRWSRSRERFMSSVRP